MTRTAIPQVIDDRLHLEDTSMNVYPVPVGSPFWFDWLTDIENRSFSFKGPSGTFTARHERQRNSWYWYAYQKHQGKVRKAYLGKAEELTVERLHSIAETLAHKLVTSITHDATTISATHADDWITALQALAPQFTLSSDMLAASKHDHTMQDFVLKVFLLRSLILQTQHEFPGTLSLLSQMLSLSDGETELLTGNLSTQPALTPIADPAVQAPQTVQATYTELFTGRECEVLELLKQGATNRDIATQLTISEGTVKKHVANVCGKLNVKTRAQAIAIVFSWQQVVG